MSAAAMCVRGGRGMLCAVTVLVAVMALSVPSVARSAAPDPDFVFTLIPSGIESPPHPRLEGPCGVGVDSAANFYVSSYYHGAVNVLSPDPSWITWLPNIDPLSGPCALALAADGALYVNSYHRSVEKFVPSSFPRNEDTTYASAGVIDTSHPTGVALDPDSGEVYVNARTYVAVYDSSGAPVLDGGAEPLRIGEGSLGDAYGLAFSAFPGTSGRIYVPDAADHTVKVYDPAIDTAVPVAVIDGSGTPAGAFTSLRDAAVAVDSESGEIYVLDNLQPEHTERPQATVHVFLPSGAYHGRLKFNVVHGEPSGLAVDNSGLATQGRVYVTSGNTLGAAVYAYPPDSATDEERPAAQTLSLSRTGSGEGAVIAEAAGIECDSVCEAEILSGTSVSLNAIPSEGSEFSGWSGAGCEGQGGCVVEMNEATAISAYFSAVEDSEPVASKSPSSDSATASPSAPVALKQSRPVASAGAVARRGELQVSVKSALAPRLLPRLRAAPVAISVGGQVSMSDGSQPPQLTRMQIEMNRHGRLETRGLPACAPHQIQPATSRQALSACRQALVGQGRFQANVALPGQEAYPTQGRLLVFNGRRGRQPVLLGHIYTSRPFNNSFLIVFSIRKINRGQFGTALTTSLPGALGDWGHLTGIEMRLSRIYRHRGERRSYLSARCAAPRGVNRAAFELARITYSFEDGRRLRTSSVEGCRVRR